MKTAKHLSALALIAMFCLSTFVVLVPKAKANSTVPVVVTSSVNESSSSITLAGGADIYLYGYGTGGGAPSGDFAYGEYTSLTNQGGYLVAELAVTTSNSNHFSTESGYPVTGGAGVQGYSSYSSSFGTNNSPAAPSASDSFTVSTSGSLVVVIAIGGDEQSLSVSGLSGLQVDAAWPGSPWNSLEILHTYLDAGTYVVTEYTSQSAAGQTPAYAGDLIGVFVFTPGTGGSFPSSTSVTCSPNPVSVGSSVTCTATVSGSNPTGTVTWSKSSSMGQFNQTSVSLISGSCSVTYIDSNVGTVTITADYGGDPTNAPSSKDATLTITPVNPATSFSIFWITDTQYLSEVPTAFTNLTNWIVDNASTYNLRMVIHTGDIIQGDRDLEPNPDDSTISVPDVKTQWKNANNAMIELLNNGIPYCWCAGNHDVVNASAPWTEGQSSSDVTAFTPSYVKTNDLGFNNNPQNGASWLDNSPDGESTAVNFTFNGLKFLIVNIEWNAPVAVLNPNDPKSWAVQLVSEYSKLGYQIVVGTHAYINSDGTTDSGGQDGSNPDFISRMTTLLTNYPNVFLTLNGHFSTDTGYYKTVGNRYDLMFDRQGDPTITPHQSWDEFPDGAEAVTIFTFGIAQQSQIEARTIDLNQNSGRGAFLPSPFNPTSSNYEDAFVLTLPFSVVSPLYSVVRGLDNRIYYGDWMVLPGSTIDSPAAAMLNGELYIVVRGSDGNSLWYGYLTDPADPNSFSGWTLLGGATNSAPTLASNGTALCLVVRGLDNCVYYCCYSGGSWGSWYAVPTGMTPDAPAASMLGNDLHIVVRGMDGSSLWDTIVSCDGAVVRGWNLVSGATPSRPVLACSGSESLCLVVEGMDNAIYYRSYTGSTDSWGDWSALPTGATNDGPGATVMGNILCTVVRGMDGSSIWQGAIDLSTSGFSGWTLLGGATPSAPTLTS